MTGYAYYLCLGLHCYIGFLGNDVVHVAKLVIIFGFQDIIDENLLTLHYETTAKGILDIL